MESLGVEDMDVVGLGVDEEANDILVVVGKPLVAPSVDVLLAVETDQVVVQIVVAFLELQADRPKSPVVIPQTLVHGC